MAIVSQKKCLWRIKPNSSPFLNAVKVAISHPTTQWHSTEKTKINLQPEEPTSEYVIAVVAVNRGNCGQFFSNYSLSATAIIPELIANSLRNYIPKRISVLHRNKQRRTVERGNEISIAKQLFCDFSHRIANRNGNCNCICFVVILYTICHSPTQSSSRENSNAYAVGNFLRRYAWLT